MDACGVLGCGGNPRWWHGGRALCRSHALDAAMRSGTAAELRPVAVRLGTVWDELQAELEAVEFDHATEREIRLREIAWCAIEAGREAAGGSVDGTEG